MDSSVFHSLPIRMSLSIMLFVYLTETSALPGSRSAAGPAPQSAAGLAQKRKGTTFVKAYSSGVCDGWAEARKENLGPGARSARWGDWMRWKEP